DGERDGLGPLGGTRARGFFLHASLVIDRSNQRPLGVLAMSMWARTDEKKRTSTGKKRHGNETIVDPQRESLRWERSIVLARELLLELLDSLPISTTIPRRSCRLQRIERRLLHRLAPLRERFLMQSLTTKKLAELLVRDTARFHHDAQTFLRALQSSGR